VPEKAVLVALDEHGKAVDSRAFAEFLRKWRDGGTPEVVFAIGGADGHGAAILGRSDLELAFGAMTWPHQFARLMLAEQLYRAVTILTGHPYHRD
jgi:23S rRNA (pseudouridine1915-N3)-methyltransferase